MHWLWTYNNPRQWNIRYKLYIFVLVCHSFLYICSLSRAFIMAVFSFQHGKRKCQVLRSSLFHQHRAAEGTGVITVHSHTAAAQLLHFLTAISAQCMRWMNSSCTKSILDLQVPGVIFKLWDITAGYGMPSLMGFSVVLVVSRLLSLCLCHSVVQLHVTPPWGGIYVGSHLFTSVLGKHASFLTIREMLTFTLRFASCFERVLSSFLLQWSLLSWKKQMSQHVSLITWFSSRSRYHMILSFIFYLAVNGVHVSSQ